MSLLEEFWYGNIEPMEYDTSSCKEYKKLLELICRNEEKLRATMTDEQKELFEKYTDCVREYQTITDCLLFQNSFQPFRNLQINILFQCTADTDFTRIEKPVSTVNNNKMRFFSGHNGHSFIHPRFIAGYCPSK